MGRPASISSALLPPSALPTPFAGWLTATRGLRAGRRRPPPSAAAHAAAAAPERPAVAASSRRAPQEPPVPSFIRVRELAKLLKLPVDDVVKRVTTRRNRRFHMTLDDDRFEFKTVKEIVLPFELARDVAAQFGRAVRFEDVEPAPLDAAQLRVLRSATGIETATRQPVIAVMGHVDHGKTTLMDTLRQSRIAQSEAHGITQKINICQAQLTPELSAMFLDTPGHFHFYRMRNSAAQLADLVVLMVAADEGCLLQTEESIGAVEDSGLPVVACINKIDIASPDQIAAVREELRSFVALQRCPILEISAKTGANLDGLRDELAALAASARVLAQRQAVVGREVAPQGIVLESLQVKGRGMVLRVLLQHGVLKKQDHFVAGMIHGVVRSLRNADSGKELSHAEPGVVVDVVFANKSKNVDAPIEFGFFALPESHAKRVIEQRQLAMDFAESALPLEDADEEDETVETTQEEDVAASREHEDAADGEDEDASTPTSLAAQGLKPIVVKADGAGSLATIQDTVDEMPGLKTVRLGIGHITAKDVDVAINKDCPIFGFKVRLRRREQKLAAARGVRVVLRSTIHGLLEEITRFQQGT
ncbi:hypothetical protein P43SY_007110 [Pythium insidiosum]|uniref:Tr-type G domain-containing protein n=1 Tax=Pythium insidiosum TaxID=114742 RepID=A0AAD5Q7L7_PYTIN|nr:hypothetical protein P43SY_007110 [Pythium insidiosum]